MFFLYEKIKTKFTSYEQQLFISSFYCYFKYNSKTDFVIDLDNVWKWLGFTNKAHSKYTLEKNFTIDKDYIINDTIQNNKKSGRGGHNKIFIMLNIYTIKILFQNIAQIKKKLEIDFNLKCILIDDNLTNLENAAALGWKTIQHTNT